MPQKVLQAGKSSRRVNQSADSQVMQQYQERSRKSSVAFITPDGGVFEVGDDAEGIGRATALASEHSLSRLWDVPEEVDSCRIFQEEI